MEELFLMAEEPQSNLARCLREKEDIENRLQKITDERIIEIVSLTLLCNMYEQYLKLLKLLYCKINQISMEDLEKNKRPFWNWLTEEYSLLWEGFNPDLRHDFSHYLLTERDDYSIEDLNREKNILLSKLITGIVCMSDFIYVFFESSLGTIIDNV